MTTSLVRHQSRRSNLAERPGRPPKLSSDQVDELITWIRKSETNREMPPREVCVGPVHHWGVSLNTMSRGAYCTTGMF